MSKMNSSFIVFFAVIVLILGVLLAVNSAGNSNPSPTASSFDEFAQKQQNQSLNNKAQTSPAPPPNPTFAPVTELKIEDIQVGTGEEVATGSSVSVNYTGALTDGKVFDTSLGKQPFSFQVGTGQVIKGWDEGLLGMKVGGKRRLTIPSDKAYGAYGAGGVIPPNATLIFDIELLEVK